MKILHTSDWHLGRSLYGRKRYQEFSDFLYWLTRTIEEERVDALLIAGDIFDSCTPSNRAQELYYGFLSRIAGSCCRHVVVIAGNHDSPSFLNAPKELLRALNVHVVGSISDTHDEVILLERNGLPEIIVCAVPYLRDKDIRMVEAGETIDHKNAKLTEGLIQHYADVCTMAERRRAELVKSGYSDIPIIAMGHLFTAGGKSVDGDGVRDLYVGSLLHIGKDSFPSVIDYLALGHLHIPQQVAGIEHFRYSGSPIPMGYGEANQKKLVLLVTFNTTRPSIRELWIPCFQKLIRIVGSLEVILTKLEDLKRENSTAWVEIEYTGVNMIANLHELLNEAIADSTIEIRRIKNRQIMDRTINRITENETLDNLGVEEVFSRCLNAFGVSDDDREELTRSYNEIVKELMERDINAE